MEDIIDKQKNRKKQTRILYLLFFAIVIGSIIFISRGPYISNALKKLILPELEAMSGQKVISKKIYINIFPLFVEAKDLKVFDEDGDRILLAERVKGYIEPSGLLSKHLSIRRLVIKAPDVTTDSKKVEEVVTNIRTYLEKEEKKLPLKVKIRAIEIDEGVAFLRDEGLKSLITIGGLKGEAIFVRDPRLDVSIKKFDIEKEGLTKIIGDIDTSLVFRKDEIDIKKLRIGSYGSEFRSSETLSKGKGTFKTEIALLIDSLKHILNLKQRGEGRIFAKGEIRFEDLNPSALLQRWKDTFIDLKLKGDFYIQTLMEVLKVEEKIEGLVEFHGGMKGRLSDISASGEARLKKGNLFGVEIDSLRCNVAYHDGVMAFENGDARLYNGNAKAEASINIPDVEPFSLKIEFGSIDSRSALKLIGWEPDIPAGKVKGDLITSGSKFNPDGWFVYEALYREQKTKGKKYQYSSDNVLGRIRNIKGSYSLHGDILSFSGLQLNTSLSDLQLDGTVDLAKKTLNLKGGLNTNEVSDLTLPYYTGLKGQGNLHGVINGKLDSPEISGSINISNAFVEGYRAHYITSRFSYNKNLLNVHELLVMPPGEEHRLKGRILFPGARELFELSGPVYEMDASVKNADLRELLQIYFKDLPLKGRLNADFRIGNKDKDIKITGNARIDKTELYKVPVDSVSTDFLYINKEFSFKQAIIKTGISTLTAEGTISQDEKFSFKASSDKILLKDTGVKDIPEDSYLSFRSEGQGTFKNPDISLSAKFIGGVLEGRSLGSGVIEGAIKDRNISLNALFFDEKVKFTAKGYLKDDLPWNAEVEIRPGRYDVIFCLITKGVPEDLTLDLGGHIDIKGNIDNVEASAHIKHLILTLSGYSFSNDSEIKIQLANRRLSFPAFAVRTRGDTLVKLSGDIDIGREYNLLLEGRSSLLPFKGLSRSIEHLAGDADLSLSITGKWEKPDMHGELNVSNVSLGFRDYHQRISSINGYINIDEDRIIVKRLSGKMGGGDINVSGLLYLEGFGIRRFYLEADLDDITAYPSKDLIVSFKGNLLYKGTTNSHGISGDIKVKSAKYKEKIDWKQWIFKSKVKEIPKAEVSKFDRTELNVKISGSKNIYIDNNIARAPVTVDMVVRGTISRPILLGRLESKEGFAYFRNNEFRIIHASADFADPRRINPFLDLKAETSVSGYNIRLALEGQMTNFSLSLSSNPPLEEMDILALLTVGKMEKQLTGLEGGIGAGEATSFLTGELQDVFEERLRTITGLDRLQIDPYVSKSTGTVGPRVTVSKRVVSNRLSVTYTTLLGSTEEHVLKLEYLLNRNISLIGSRDEKGSAGGDIKFRFEFK